MEHPSWRQKTAKKPAAQKVEVQNCELPERVKGFVEGENMSVLMNALRDKYLRPIAAMGTGAIRDVGKPGSGYVYFRVMIGDEEPNNMAFNSVGSSLTDYRVRMLFDKCIWTTGRGGYVRAFDAMGRINSTPFSQEEQLAQFGAILGMTRAVRGSTEVGIKGEVSMTHLKSAWCVFPFSKERIEAYTPPAGESRSGIKSPIQEASEKYRDILRYLPNAVDRGAIGIGSKNWIVFTK